MSIDGSGIERRESGLDKLQPGDDAGLARADDAGGAGAAGQPSHPS